MICLNCLLAIRKNKSELDKFFELNKHEKNYDNDNSINNNYIDNPFHDLYEKLNLKIFNDIDIKKKITNNKKNESNNNKSKSIFKKITS